MSHHKCGNNEILIDFQARVERLTTDVVHEYLQRKPHRAVKGDFAMFPTNELTRALKA